MLRNIIFSFALFLGLVQNKVIAQCYVSLGDVTGYQIPQGDLDYVNTTACNVESTLPTAYQSQFKVFSASFYVEEEFCQEYPYSDAFEQIKQKAGQQSPYYVVFGWQSDSKGLNTRVFVDVKLPHDPAFCFPELDSMVKGVLIDKINENFSDCSGTGIAKMSSEIWGLDGLAKYLDAMKVCCAAGGDPNNCLNCGSSGNNKALLNAMGFKKIQIHNVSTLSTPYSSPDIINEANLSFTSEDLDLVDIGEKYSEIINKFHAQGFSIKVIITKDSTLCTARWEELKGIANSNQYNMVYWNHIHQGNGPEDEWLYTQVYFHGGGVAPDSLSFRPGLDSLGERMFASNVIAGLASAATDFLFQVIIHYTFDEDIDSGDWGKAVGRVDQWEVAKSGIFGMFGINTKVAAVASALADATVQTISIANYYEQHPPQSPPNPPSYDFKWAAKDFSNIFVDNLIDEGLSLLLGGAAGKVLGKAKEIPFSGWCKIARIINRHLGTMIPGCFTAGTPITTVHGICPIEHLRPGEWTLTKPELSPYQFAEFKKETSVKDNDVNGELWTGLNAPYLNSPKTTLQPEITSLPIPVQPDYDLEEITPESWVVAHLNVQKTDGTLCYISMLRSYSWLEELGLCLVGDSAWLDLSDMRVSGMAQVISFEGNTLDTRSATSRALLERGYYPVLTTFQHKADEVLYVRFTNGDRLNVTAPHPFWSIDRDGWVPAQKLHVGERLKTISGETTVDSLAINFDSIDVYNLEIWKAHNFCVGENREIVHNGCNFVGEFDALIKKYGVRLVRVADKFYDNLPEGFAFYGKKIISGAETKVFYTKYGFPDFKQWCPGQSFCFHVNDLAGSSQDFTRATNYLINKFGSSKVKKIPGSTKFQIFENGVWKDYTWHHHEDCETLMPVLSEIHNNFAHTGGSSMIEKAKSFLIGLFESPYSF
ncbi:MAG: HNH endonuclease [Saprospiraceae bacterium]